MYSYLPKVLNCKTFVEYEKNYLLEAVARRAVHPVLAIIQGVANGESIDASDIYVRNKIKDCEEVGIEPRHFILDVNKMGFEEIQDEISSIVKNPDITGVIIQSPFPGYAQYKMVALWNLVPIEKDVDCLSDAAQGALINNQTLFAPCTAAGILDLLDFYEIGVYGKHCVIVGKSLLVGKPLAHLLMGAGATVTICNSKTENLSKYTKDADIIISATGKPHLINSSMVSPHTIIIDVGITRDENNKLCGDVDMGDLLDNVDDVHVTPVPGGVGLLTRTALLSNTIYKCSV